MKITKTIENDKPLYEILLSSQDFDDLCAGCPESGFIGAWHNDIYFHLMEAPSFGKSWHSMSDGYFLNIGVDPVRPPPSATSEQWDKAAQATYDRLEQTIKDSGKLPLVEEMILFGKTKTLTLGYAVLKLESSLETQL